MSKQPTRPSRHNHVATEIVTDPAEIAAIEERDRQYRKTALGKIGCDMVVDAPVDMLAQVVAEMPADDQQVFLKELFAHLPAAALPQVEELLRARQKAVPA